METAASVAVDVLVSIFADANRLRMDVITDIVKATTELQAALFLEALCQLLAGFKYQGQEFQNPLLASPPLMIPQNTPEPAHGFPKPVPQHGQTHPHMIQHHRRHEPARLAPRHLRSLWMGELKDYMDSDFLYNCFAKTGEVVSGQAYNGFIEFKTRAAAQRALQAYNNTPIPDAFPPQRFRKFMLW